MRLTARRLRNAFASIAWAKPEQLAAVRSAAWLLGVSVGELLLVMSRLGVRLDEVAP